MRPMNGLRDLVRARRSRGYGRRTEFVCERPELGDLNVIIQIEEWHSSDRFGGTVRARESGHLGPESGVRCR